MADVNANIGVNIDTSAALAQLKDLQRQISQFHSSIAKSSQAAALAQRDLQRNFLNSVNALGAFSAELRTVKTTAESFTDSLERNKFSMRQYFSYAGASTKTFGKLFKSEYDTIGKVAEDRVKKLQTQYIQMGRDASGAMKAIAITPNELDMGNFATQTQIAAQKQALFNQLMKQGSTNLLNFGKNTQWAGRQLMVGFTLPLMAVGSAASKSFMEMEAQALKFKKVYGDLFTPQAETQQALADIQELAKQFTKYGIAVADTVGLAADAAAAGFQGIDLQRQTTQATRLSVLGQIDNQQALETTIALQNAFSISSAELAQNIDFLNAVENQTVVSLDDITTAIPKVAPVIQQLGGDVKDLAFFLTAMKEGGINASEGANALKSGLAALINPTTRAKEMLQGLGIDIVGIVEKDKGNLKKTVVDFAKALDTLAPLQRAQAIEQMFGKFQFARLSTLFQNVTKDGTQASRVLELAGSSVQDLATLSDQELGKTADSAMNKFRKSVEDLKAAIVPVGEAFLKTVTPIIDVVAKIADKFAGLSDGTKKAITIMVTVIGGLGPILLMTFGLLANGVANIIKLFLTLRTGYQKLTGQSQNLGEQTNYLTVEQLNAEAAAHSLNQAHATLTQQFTVEAEALQRLIAAYTAATSAAARFAGANPGMMIPPKARKKFAGGGIVRGPGGPKDDKIQIMASNGEAVIDAQTVDNNKELINQLLLTGKVDPNRVAKPAMQYEPTMSRSVTSLMRGIGLPGATVGGLPPSNVGMVAANAPGMKIERAHATEAFGRDSEQFKAALESTKELKEFNEKFPGAVRVVSNLTAELPANLNQAMKETLKGGSLHGGKDIAGFQSEYASLTNKFNASAQRGGANISDPKIKAALSNFEIAVGQRAVEIAKNTKDLKVTDTIFAKATRETITEFEKMGEESAQVSKALDKVSKQVGQIRVQPSQDQYRAGLASGDIKIDPSGKVARFGSLEVARPTKNTKAGLPAARTASNINTPGNYKVGKNLSVEAKNVTDAAVLETARAAGVQSPSKRTIPIGEDIARGLEVGMANRKANVAKSGENLANNAVSGARRATRAQGAPMSQVSSQLVSVPKTEEQLKKFNSTLTQSSPKLVKMNNAIQGGSFAMMSLAGVAQMFGGTLGKISNVIFNVSGALFGLQTITQLLTKSIVTEIVLRRANNVAMAMGATSFKALFAGAATLGARLLTFGRFALNFLGPWGKLAAVTITVGTALFALNKAQKAAKEKTEAFSNALVTTTDQLKTLGDYFGITPTVSALEKKTGFAPGTAGQINEVEKFKQSDEFKKYAAPVVKDIKNLNDTQAVQVLNAKMFELLGAGFSKEQIQIIIQSIQQEAKRTDLKIDFESVNIDKLPANILKDFEKEAKKMKKGAWISTILGTPEQRAKAMVPFKSEAAIVNKYLNGLSSAFVSGQINGAQFTTMFDALTTSLAKMPDKQNAIKILDTAIKNMSPNLAKAAAGVKNLEIKMLLLKAASIGLGDEISKEMVLAAAYTGPDLILQDIAKRSKATLEQLIADQTAGLVAAQKAVGDALAGGAGGASADTLSKAAKLNIARLQKELDLLKTKRDTINEANNELKRQYEYQQRLLKLSQDAVQAKISGDYIGASILEQQKSFETEQFNKETDNIALDKRITNLENRISALQANARLTAAEQAYAKSQGKVVKKAMGGLIKGPGTGTSDSIMARFALGGLPQLQVSNGEYIVQAKAVQKYGVGFMDAINNQKISSTTASSSAQSGNTVYNIDMVINGGDATTIADQVIRKLKIETSKNNKTNMVKY